MGKRDSKSSRPVTSPPFAPVLVRFQGGPEDGAEIVIRFPQGEALAHSRYMVVRGQWVYVYEFEEDLTPRASLNYIHQTFRAVYVGLRHN